MRTIVGGILTGSGRIDRSEGQEEPGQLFRRRREERDFPEKPRIFRATGIPEPQNFFWEELFLEDAAFGRRRSGQVFRVVVVVEVGQVFGRVDDLVGVVVVGDLWKSSGKFESKLWCRSTKSSTKARAYDFSA